MPWILLRGLSIIRDLKLFDDDDVVCCKTEDAVASWVSGETEKWRDGNNGDHPSGTPSHTRCETRAGSERHVEKRSFVQNFEHCRRQTGSSCSGRYEVGACRGFEVGMVSGAGWYWTLWPEVIWNRGRRSQSDDIETVVATVLWSPLFTILCFMRTHTLWAQRRYNVIENVFNASNKWKKRYC